MAKQRATVLIDEFKYKMLTLFFAYIFHKNGAIIIARN